LFLKLMVVK